jgi:hypothetical protein
MNGPGARRTAPESTPPESTPTETTATETTPVIAGEGRRHELRLNSQNQHRGGQDELLHDRDP